MRSASLAIRDLSQFAGLRVTVFSKRQGDDRGDLKLVSQKKTGYRRRLEKMESWVVSQSLSVRLMKKLCFLQLKLL